MQSVIINSISWIPHSVLGSLALQILARPLFGVWVQFRYSLVYGILSQPLLGLSILVHCYPSMLMISFYGSTLP